MNVVFGNIRTSTSEPARMPEPAPNAELLRALGRLLRGLSALFWGLPIALVICVQSAKGDWFRPMGVFPALAATAVLYHGLHLLGNFQSQERVWISALERAKVIALVNIALSPFLFWYNKVPGQTFFAMIVSFLALSGLGYLMALNPVLWRLAAMLPDETLRQETKFFTTFNRYLLIVCFGLVLFFTSIAWTNAAMIDQVFDFAISYIPPDRRPLPLLILADKGAGLWIVLFLVLLPVAMTMALIWKIKEVIFSSVFGLDH
jgi:hypothetical protein